jgi:hypothetical protein
MMFPRLTRTLRSLSCGGLLASAVLALGCLSLPGEASAQIRLKQERQWQPPSVPSRTYHRRDTPRYKADQAFARRLAEDRRRVEAQRRRYGPAIQFGNSRSPSRSGNARCCSGVSR